MYSDLSSLYSSIDSSIPKKKDLGVIDSITLTDPKNRYVMIVRRYVSARATISSFSSSRDVWS
jgi:hypothetical protein